MVRADSVLNKLSDNEIEPDVTSFVNSPTVKPAVKRTKWINGIPNKPDSAKLVSAHSTNDPNRLNLIRQLTLNGLQGVTSKMK